jgi:hypothetical protein
MDDVEPLTKCECPLQKIHSLFPFHIITTSHTDHEEPPNFET